MIAVKIGKVGRVGRFWTSSVGRYSYSPPTHLDRSY